MKNNYLLCSVFIACASMSSAVNAASDQLYVGASYGVGISDKFHYDDGFAVKKPKDGQVFGLAFGYRFDNNVRTELAFNRFDDFKYTDTDTDTGNMGDHYYRQKINSTAVFANIYYDVRKFEQVIPYANIGIGYSKNKAGNMNVRVVRPEGTQDTNVYQGKSKSQFAWNVGAGISYEVSKKFTLDLISYKYYNLGKFSTKQDGVGDSIKDKLKIHSITAGFKINF